MSRVHKAGLARETTYTHTNTHTHTLRRVQCERLSLAWLPSIVFEEAHSEAHIHFYCFIPHMELISDEGLDDIPVANLIQSLKDMWSNVSM